MNKILTNDTKEKAKLYSLSDFKNTYYLGFRDLDYLIKKYATGGKLAIDYGCGAGRSTNFLKSLGYDTIGFDISENMLQQARSLDKSSHYFKIESGNIPVLNKTYNLFFSCFVFFTISNKKELFKIFLEAHRVLEDDGIFLIVTGSEELYSHNWISYDVNFSQNKSLFPGSTTKIFLKDLGIEFTNYYWTDEVYSNLFYQAGFKVSEKHFPLGKESDNQNWISETVFPPYIIYVLQKRSNFSSGLK